MVERRKQEKIKNIVLHNRRRDEGWEDQTFVSVCITVYYGEVWLEANYTRDN